MNRRLVLLGLAACMFACSDSSVEAPNESPVATPPVTSPQAPTPQAPSVEVDCPPPLITAGEEAKELTHGLAVATPEGIAVHRFDHGLVTCENILAGFWPNPGGSTNITVRTHEGEGWVAAGNRSQMGTVTPLGNVMPGLLQVGDTVTLCVNDEVQFPRAVGKPAMTIVGRIEGTYCGVREP